MIFVFGSNEAGRHGKGAAKYAKLKYGAIQGQGFGRQGDSFAIPTKDYDLNPLDVGLIKAYFEDFVEYARENHDTMFFLTPIGCGLAGNDPREIMQMMYGVGIPRNVVLSSSWVTDHGSCFT